MNGAPISIIRLWHVVLVPLQGEISDHHAEELTDRVLHHVARTGPRGLVIDLSGVALIDSHLCAVVANLATAARLMGTDSFVSGISPEIALTLETMGVSFDRISTVRNLEDALSSFDIAPASNRRLLPPHEDRDGHENR
ncbi:MAG: STAS domain-containing protein [Deltaproteobacteria bacterium]|nr:STAS domain-containing protein [Deltaproteobacteria bacterium]MBK8714386.1 STAS domain-containing protein [Deltaproteobacteria bacterium]MBP7289137.1 STAS domain-containing protein [Nannocystaceae bacterium]